MRAGNFNKHVKSSGWSEQEGLSIFEATNICKRSPCAQPEARLSWLLSPGTPSVEWQKISSLILEVLMFGAGTVLGGKAESGVLIVVCQ